MPSERKSVSDRLTAPEVGAYLRISLSTVHHLTRTGKLKAQKQGKRWTYLKSDIDRYVNEGLSEWISGNLTEKDRRSFARRICSLEGLMKLEGEQGAAIRWAHGRVLNVSDQGMLFEVADEDRGLIAPLSQLPVPVRFSISAHGEDQAPYVFQGSLVRQEGADGRRFGVLLETSMGHLLESQSDGPR